MSECQLLEVPRLSSSSQECIGWKSQRSKFNPNDAIAIDGPIGDDTHMQYLDRREFAPLEEDILCTVFVELTMQDEYEKDPDMHYLDSDDFVVGDELEYEEMEIAVDIIL
ncbi:hypothetical protein LRAMOSA09710 [Lichtheimia ramosa]|uniref:Uncharacterized protein n=1 Tax=Lichtheimia ramosa TaxID=688394 RepID=A0A077WKZ5_9FUNG|nr:hypothetical protein LRAMOSA09710 [Lichtheimia ramosa]